MPVGKLKIQGTAKVSVNNGNYLSNINSKYLNIMHEFEPPKPYPQEDNRIRDLSLLKILDTAKDERFDRYTSLLAGLYNVDICLISLVDSDRQWFKSSQGLNVAETARNISFCGHAIHEPEILIINDAKKDQRFANNPLVLNFPFIRFYAGAVLYGPNHFPLGTLCLIDKKPRNLSDQQKKHLIQFARIVENELHLNYKLENARKQAELSVFYDPITNLPNKRLFLDRLDRAIVTCRRNSKRLLVIRTEIININLVLNAGSNETEQLIIKTLAQRLIDVLDTICTIVRWRDNEFAVLIPEVRDHIRPEDIIRIVHSALSRPIDVQDCQQTFIPRSGASIYPDDDATGDKLLKNAGTALETCRKKEGSYIQFFHTRMYNDIKRQVELENRLRKIIAQNELEIVYQPIIYLETGLITGVEVLSRWTDPDLGYISPIEFINIAEHSNLIHDLTIQVIEKSCRQNVVWANAGYLPIQISVNVTGSFVERDDFLLLIKSILEKTGMAAKSLRLELTEGSFVATDSKIVNNITACHKEGVEFAIDDFGTGYSSFGYLKRLPVSVLKLDKIFVNEITSQRVDATIAHSLISMARDLDMTVVAEGVETETQLTFLQAYMCDYCQGYYFSAPVHESELKTMLSRQ